MAYLGSRPTAAICHTGNSEMLNPCASAVLNRPSFRYRRSRMLNAGQIHKAGHQFTFIINACFSVDLKKPTISIRYRIEWISFYFGSLLRLFLQRLKISYTIRQWLSTSALIMTTFTKRIPPSKDTRFISTANRCIFHLIVPRCSRRISLYDQRSPIVCR